MNIGAAIELQKSSGGGHRVFVRVCVPVFLSPAVKSLAGAH